MKKICFFCLLFQIVALYGESDMGRMKELIQAASIDAERYPAPWELLYPESCKELKKAAENSPDLCIDILTDADVAHDEKCFLIYILSYEADFERYADLLLSSAEAYLNGNMEFSLLERMFVNMHIKRTMRANYKNRKIQAIIKQCLATDLGKEEKQFFKDLGRGRI